MTEINNINYTYIYLDPTKPGKFSYKTLCFDYEPFYVGEGKRNRCLFHLRQAERKTHIKTGNKHKFYRIKSILSIGVKPIIKKIDENISESVALQREMELVGLIGTVFDNTGPLLNLTKGGETGPKMFGELNPMFNLTGSSHPASRWERPEWYLRKQSESHIGDRNSMYGKKWSDEQKKNHSKKVKTFIKTLSDEEYNKIYKKPATENQKRIMSELFSGKGNPRFGVKLSDETKKKISMANKGRLEGGNHPKAKSWKVTTPENKEIVVDGLNFFCKNNNISADSLKLAGRENRKVETGPSKGWSAIEIKK